MTFAGDHAADHVCRTDVICREKTGGFPRPSQRLSPPCEILGTKSREQQPLNQG
jgi:hypothetical protein